MSDEHDEYAKAVSRQAGASGALTPSTAGAAMQQNAGWNNAIYPHTPDLSVRTTALHLAVQLSKPGDSFPEVIGRARAIYTFLTAGEP